MMELGIVTFVVALAASLVTTSALIRIAPRIGAVDAPGPRKVHTRPIPRIGGVGVFVGFVAAMVFAAIQSGRTFFNFHQLEVLWPVLAGCAFVMFLLGLVDDLRGLTFKSKFAVQVFAALAVWSGGFRIDVLTHPLGDGNIELGILSLPITVLWIVGITNAINLIDGLDGLAAGAALIMTGAVACIAMAAGHLGVVAVSIALVGALLGFLAFNFNPARIFLGDSGSMLLGFLLAVISIRGSQKGSTAVAVLAPLLILGLPILDTSVAILRRLVRVTRQSPHRGLARIGHVLVNLNHLFLPDRGHLHHRLMDSGVGHRGSVLTLYGVVVALALAALASVFANSLLVGGLLLGSLTVLTVTFLVLVVGVRRRRAAAARQDDAPAAGLAATAGRASD